MRLNQAVAHLRAGAELHVRTFRNGHKSFRLHYRHVVGPEQEAMLNKRTYANLQKIGHLKLSRNGVSSERYTYDVFVWSETP